ncbi:Mur ligase central domain-containing protein OS=Streptomyces antimycoticus OX=68175 GN=SANT12839_029650 PE=4 SV=1 [Streptomyces antimycoticus]
MIALSLTEIAGLVGGQPHDIPDPDLKVTGPVVIDSREVRPGSLFAALPGERVDGHDFARGAIEAGATAVLAARPVGTADAPVPAIVVPDVIAAMGALARAVVERLDATVVALTGSAGKTSTKDLIAQLLQRRGPTVWTPGNFNNEIGLPVAALSADEATLHLVLEMGARGKGHIQYLATLTPPRIGLVLNVGTAHIGEFGGREQIAEAKGELVEALPPPRRAGWRCSTPTTPWCAPWCRAPRPVPSCSGRPRTPMCVPGMSGSPTAAAPPSRFTPLPGAAK